MAGQLPLDQMNKGNAVVNGVLDGRRERKHQAEVSVLDNEDIDINQEIIEVQLISSQGHAAQVNIYWENSGYPNYNELGLYGRARTDYQIFKSLTSNTFDIKYDNYTLRVTCT